MDLLNKVVYQRQYKTESSYLLLTYDLTWCVTKNGGMEMLATNCPSVLFITRSLDTESFSKLKDCGKKGSYLS